MSETTVVNIKFDEYDVYIGRGAPRLRLKGSPWGNPFKIERGGLTREQTIAEYRDWVLTSDDGRAVWIREHVHELRGKRLGCWCRPAVCHGDVLVELADADPTDAEVRRAW